MTGSRFGVHMATIMVTPTLLRPLVKPPTRKMTSAAAKAAERSRHSASSVSSSLTTTATKVTKATKTASASASSHSGRIGGGGTALFRATTTAASPRGGKQLLRPRQGSTMSSAPSCHTNVVVGGGGRALLASSSSSSSSSTLSFASSFRRYRLITTTAKTKAVMIRNDSVLSVRVRHRPLSSSSSSSSSSSGGHSGGNGVSSARSNRGKTSSATVPGGGNGTGSGSSSSTSQRATVARPPRGTRRSAPTTPPPPPPLQRPRPRTQPTPNTSISAPANPTTARNSDMYNLIVALRKGMHEILLRPRTVAVPRWITPKRFTVTYSECFGHASFILVAASYATDDFLTLRCVAVVGSTSMLLFTYFHPHGRVLWLPFKWNVLFIAINSYRIGKVVMQRYWAEYMPDELKRLNREHFFVIHPVDFAKLVKLGTEETFGPGDLIVAQHEPNRYIRLVLSGEVEVLRDGVLTYVMDEANFMSEAGLHAGLMLRDNVESCCSIVARRKTPGGSAVEENVRTLRWDRNVIVDLLEREPQLRGSFRAALSWDIVRKLKGQRVMLSAGEVADPERWTSKRREQNDDRYAAILSNVLRHPDYRLSYGNELNKYRIIHHINDQKHAQALERCGWTPEEFKLGRRLRSAMDEDDDDVEEEHSRLSKLKWKVHSLLARVLG